MFYLFFLIFLILSAALMSTVLKTGVFRTWGKVFRITAVLLCTSIFAYIFFTRSLTKFRADALTVQLINKLPMPLDFYIVKVNEDENKIESYEASHLGTIRSAFYRIEYLDMSTSDEFWVVGYMGRKNRVYFSQHSVPNKNEDQIIEVQNYINQSQKLSDVAGTQIESLKFENMKTAIWITLDLLLLFLNTTLLLRRKK